MQEVTAKDAAAVPSEHPMVAPKKKDNSQAKNSADTVKIVFTPLGRQGQVAVGSTVLQAARSLGVDIDSVCGGRAMCGRCQVVVTEGDFAKHGIRSSSSSVTPPSAVENRYDEKRGLGKGRRLSCQAILKENVVIDVPATSQVHSQVIRKDVDSRVIEVDAASRLCYIEVREPDMHEPSGDLRRVIEALHEQWPDRVESDISADLNVLHTLQAALRKGEWRITVALYHGHRIIGVWPGLKDRIIGAAIDIGSTTMSVHLCDMNSGEVIASSGAMNPQIRFGEDLMSRVSYGMLNDDGAAEMTTAVREGLQNLLVTAAEQGGLDKNDIIEIVLVGNPVMHHLVLGIDPIELGGAPFALTVDQSLEIRAQEIDFDIHPSARVYILPCIAGHVGADAAAVTLAERPGADKMMTLVVDVGTNAEIICGNSERLLAASSPTGPAFEGAQISSGQRAAPGAIERVRIDTKTLEPRFRIIGVEAWSDEDGFAEATAEIGGITGICGSGIIEVLAEMYLAGIITEDGVIDGSTAAISPRVEEDGRTFCYKLADGVTITQNDVRAIQLAKAALYAGFRLLMDKLEIDHVERVVLAGAFGSHIESKYAMVLGMIPDCDLDQVRSAGNSAGTGARICLLNKGSRQLIENIVRDIEKIETAVEPDFQQHFVNAMAFPHKTASYPKLSKVVTLPERSLDSNSTNKTGEGSRGRRRRR